MRIGAHVILIAVIFYANSNFSDAISINCTFSTTTYYALIGRVYDCTARIIDGRESDILTAVHGTHQPGRRDEDVQYLLLIHQQMGFFLRNIETFFPRLTSLTFIGNSITHITVAHLMPLRSLVFLDLAMNDITSLDSDILSVYRTRSMNFIRFSNNNLTCVGKDFFLPTAQDIDFRFNPCIDQRAVTPSQVANLRSNLLANCLSENCPSENEPPESQPPENDPPENKPPENCPPIDCQLLTNLNVQVQSLLQLAKNNENLLTNLLDKQLKLENALNARSYWLPKK